MKVYGPYKRKDGRLHVVIVYEDGSKRTKSYPRYLMEQHIGRELSEEETVDHIDHDFTNNSIDNLQILTRQENARKEMSREKRTAKQMECICPICSKIFTTFMRDYKRSQIVLKKAGPFCSKSCAGKYRK